MRNFGLKILSFTLGLVLLATSVVLLLALSLPLLGFTVKVGIFQKAFTLVLFYGYSAFAIPAIILFCAIVLIVPVWNKKLNLLIVITPLIFFTFVFFERLSGILVKQFASLNISVLLNGACFITSFLVVALEIALAIMFGEKLSISKIPVDKTPDSVDIVADGYTALDNDDNGSINGKHNISEFSSELSEFKTTNPDENSAFFQPETTTGIPPEPESGDAAAAIIAEPEARDTATAAPLLAETEPLETGFPENGALLQERTEFLTENFEAPDSTEGTTDSPENTIPDVVNETAPADESPQPDSLLDSLVVLPNDIEEISTDVDEMAPVTPDEMLEYQTEDLSDLDIIDDSLAATQPTQNTAIKSETLDIDRDIAVHDKRDLNTKDVSILTKPEESDDDKSSLADSIVTVPHAMKYKYEVPSNLLTEYPDNQYWIVDDKTRRDARILKETFQEFKIDVDIRGITKGPVVTMFEVLPAPGIRLNRITGLQNNIALRLAAPSVRIVAPIPGKEAVGIEVPNANRAIVSMRELIETDIPHLNKMAIPVLLGKDITGRPQTMDIAQTPHLLIAGATGSGKSVCVNSIILSILYNKTPDEVRLLLVDPKIVELNLYNGIAHLLTPVITEPKKAFQALQYCLCEMERRYALLDGMSVRDIKSYNRKIKREHIAAEALPYIVIIIDEYADLMVTIGKELENTVARLCAMSRAVGIHLVLATQRPSTKVITGLIKANIPTRIAFMVASNTDSRIILDESGAENLIGKGDMLYVSITNPFPVRIQGTYVSDDDVEKVVAHVKKLRAPEYIDDEIFINEDNDNGELFVGDSDPLYDEALDIVLLEGKASASYLQRRLKIGYNRAARIVEEMQERGVVGPANGSKPRDVIYNPGTEL